MCVWYVIYVFVIAVSGCSSVRETTRHRRATMRRIPCEKNGLDLAPNTSLIHGTFFAFSPFLTNLLSLFDHWLRRPPAQKLDRNKLLILSFFDLFKNTFYLNLVNTYVDNMTLIWDHVSAFEKTLLTRTLTCSCNNKILFKDRPLG